MNNIDPSELASAFGTIIANHEKAGINLLAAVVLAVLEAGKIDRTEFARALISILDMLEEADPSDETFQLHAQALRHTLLGDYESTATQSE